MPKTWRRRSPGTSAEADIVFNPRQLTMMVRLLLAGLALRTVTGNPSFPTRRRTPLTSKPLSPKIQGIVRSKVNKDMVHGVIRTVVGGFTLGDPVMIARDLEELAAVEVTDSLAWLTAMSERSTRKTTRRHWPGWWRKSKT